MAIQLEFINCLGPATGTPQTYDSELSGHLCTINPSDCLWSVVGSERGPC